MNDPTRRILRWFEYDHLPPESQQVSKPFYDLAHQIAEQHGDTPHGAELTTGLRKLLEAKDCIVRASLPE